MTQPLALVFPGQNSQSVGMLADLAAAYPIVIETFAEVSDIVQKDLWQLVSEGPAQQLDQTQNTQPALLAAGVAIWRCWQNNDGPIPLCMAGHSLGEYSALVAAGCLSLPDAARLVQRRAQLMCDALPAHITGSMAAILGLDDETVQQVCSEHAEGTIVSAANFNAPGQVVIAGEQAAVARVIAAAKQRGAKRAIPLAVSVPSHCALMKEASLRLRTDLEQYTINVPQIPVLHNATAATACDPNAIRDLLAQQLFQPVRWVDTVLALKNQYHIQYLFECGPGKVLTGLHKRIDNSLIAKSLADVQSLQAALSDLTTSVTD
jgi:[acyl-carrier-protein] S-malonyltransferase